jgi:hypothetical protein
VLNRSIKSAGTAEAGIGESMEASIKMGKERPIIRFIVLF